MRKVFMALAISGASIAAAQDAATIDQIEREIQWRAEEIRQDIEMQVLDMELREAFRRREASAKRLQATLDRIRQQDWDRWRAQPYRYEERPPVCTETGRNASILKQAWLGLTHAKIEAKCTYYWLRVPIDWRMHDVGPGKLTTGGPEMFGGPPPPREEHPLYGLMALEHPPVEAE